MIKLDKKDKIILDVLDFNARASFTEIAKKTGMSKQLVKYRFDELVRKGIIKGTYAAVDMFKAGYGCYQIFLKLQNVTRQKEKEVISYISRIKQIKRLSLVGGGDWDIIFVVWIRNIAGLEDIMNKISIKYGKFIFNKYISISTGFFYFRNKFAYDAKDFPSIKIDVGQECPKLDKRDKLLIRMLNKDARASSIQLSKKLKISAVTVNKKIKALQNKGIIRQFRLQINESLLDFVHHHLFLKLTSLNPQRINELMEYLKIHKNVLSVTRAIEKSDLEIDLLVKSPKEFYDIISGLRYEFQDIFRDYTWYILYDAL